MSSLNQQEAWLLLQDGTRFKGYAAGKIGTCGGEICFNTGMTGYQEIYTDPSYFGQIMVNTNVHIGNYGILSKESESDQVQIKGLVCRNFSSHMSRSMATESLQEYLERNNIVCIYGIDTRALVRHIRIHGAMNAVISSEVQDIEILNELLHSVPNMQGLELASKVTTESAYFVGNPASKFKVAAMDFGIKKSILKQLEAVGFYVKVFPAKTEFKEINKWNPDAFFLSNGPGDPEPMDYAIENISQMIHTKKPVFGICLGHQLISLAIGISTFKMHHGHRGTNHPVKNLITGLGEITSQNHGFSVAMNDIQKRHEEVSLSHINLNDQSVEGIKLTKFPVFSVQYHPEAGPGPHDSRYLFNQFYELTASLNQVYSTIHE
ncbi:MAG: glutamine-hydrolyzing carbamoyl-phosphate synthase small subunit [Saprospiraceae bacterium]|nr:glutamine-hydrolyzing carbamoyl-phosphate synthase small subunit [Saprospiraceae bacterium]MBK9728069.1 glutamine-hydrolyzing carbamoyl-phosphate synthase small subunit [Saprospiraceae bacterium]